MDLCFKTIKFAAMVVIFLNASHMLHLIPLLLKGCEFMSGYTMSVER